MFDRCCGAYFNKDGDEFVNIITKPLVRDAPHVEAALRREAQRLARVRQRRATASLLRASLALASLGAAMLSLYRGHKDARALLDYDDLVFWARDLLCSDGVPPWVLFKLDGGIDHILVDEAQDTNPEQWEVVAKLADEFFVGWSQG